MMTYREQGDARMTLGARIKRQRQRRGLSQNALAKLARVPQPLISMLEADTRQHTSSDVVRSLAKALGCTTDYLLSMHEDEESVLEPADGALAVPA
jgi:transcriptional regulator with XRE-family HTH domain